jgi:hypothetical protein
MKTHFKNSLACCMIAFLFAACSKSVETGSIKDVQPPSPVNTPAFVDYLIKKGEQSCNSNPYQPVNISELKFMVKFDSSAIYQTVDPDNQVDINKLYGFSDNNALHHQFSARFGWRWRNNELQVFGYIYNNGTMSFKQIGTAKIGEENNCSIKVASNKYIFTLNESSIEMPRASTTGTAIGYQLYPFFGGTEMAPHDVHIWIKGTN